MSGGYFGSYWPDGYFAGFFGPTEPSDPNAMRGTAAGVATVTGTISSLGGNALIGSAAGVATVSGLLGATGFSSVTGGWANRRRRKKRVDVRTDDDQSLWAAVDAAFAKVDKVAAQAAAAVTKSDKEAEGIKAAAYLAAYEAAAEAASAKIAAEIAALQSRIEAADTAIAKAYAKAEDTRQRLEIERHEREIRSRLEAARKEAEEAYQRFLELEAANDDDEEAAAALLMILEAMNEQRAA